MDNGLVVLAAIGIRTLLDRASQLLDVNPARSFASKLDELVRRDIISAREKSTLSVLTDAGNAAAHRGWKPEPKALDTMMDAIENFLHRTFVVDEAAKRLQHDIPARPKRAK